MMRTHSLVRSFKSMCDVPGTIASWPSGIASYIEQVCAKVATSSSPAITSTGHRDRREVLQRQRRLGEGHDPGLLLHRPARAPGPSGECSPKRCAHWANSSLSRSKVGTGNSPSKW